MLQCPQTVGRPFSRLCLRLTFLLIVFFVPFAPASVLRAGSLSGPIENEGLQTEVIGIIQMPASAIARPLAPINELKQVPDGGGRLFVNGLRGPLYSLEAESITLYLDLSVRRPDLPDSEAPSFR